MLGIRLPCLVLGMGIACSAFSAVQAAPRDALPTGPTEKRGQLTGPEAKKITPVKRDPTCAKEVAKAFKKQREAGAFAMKARMIDQRGVVFMNSEYILPSKMRQQVRTLTSPEPNETVLVDERGWTKSAGKSVWQELTSIQAGELAAEFRTNVVDPENDPLFYECKDDVTEDGKTLRVYEGVQLTPLGKIEENSPIRIVKVDDGTGLPVSNAVAPRGQPERAYFKASYSYPSDLKIEAPGS